MTSNITNLSELESVLCQNDKTNEGILHFFSTFKITRLISAFGSFKSKGVKVSVLLLSLLIYRLRGESINMMQNKNKNFLEKIDDNTFYRLMNNPWMNWRKLLMGFAKQFNVIAKTNGDNTPRIKCFVLDDTVVEKAGKTIESIGKVFNHVNQLYQLGFKLLLLGFWDGKSLVATDCSLHSEEGKKGNYGMTKKELKSQFRKKRDPKSPASKRVQEIDMKKGDVAVSMIKRAVKNGLIANYVLMDSWFVSDYMIKSIRSIKKGAMHILGMCKMDKRQYTVDKKLLKAHELIAKYGRKRSKYSRKYKATYISLVVDYKGSKVRLFFLRYNNAKKWTLLLTTDLNISFIKTVEIYQIRWTIEVLFKECKQYLRLGGSQNTDFDGQIADITITLVTHTILSLQKRFTSYETMGELFRENQLKLLELTLWERLIKLFIKLMIQMAIILTVDIEELMEKLMQNDQTSLKLLTLLKAIDNFDDNQHNHSENVNCSIVS